MIYFVQYEGQQQPDHNPDCMGRFLGEDSPKYTKDIPVLFLSFSNPYHLADVPMVGTYVNAYACNETTVAAMIEKIMGRSSFQGISPVDPFAGLWDARL